MEPYRIKHKATGLYYKPGKPNLSKIGKVYITNNSILNYLKLDYIYIVSDNISLTRKLNKLDCEGAWIQPKSHSTDVCFKIPKSEFEKEYLYSNKKKENEPK